MLKKLKDVGAKSVTDAYILIMLLVFPLFTGFRGYAAVTFSKYLFFVCATSLWLLCLFAVAARRFAGGGFFAKRPNLVQSLVLLFMLISCLSAALSPYGFKTVLGAGRYDGLLTLLLYGAIFLGVSASGRLREAHVLALGASTAICCAVCILQFFGYNALWLFPAGLSYYDAHTLYSGEFLGTIGNTNLLSAFLCLAVPLLSARYASRAESGAILILPAALGMFVLMSSSVAGGVVAIALSALICAPVIISDAVRLRRGSFAAAVLCLVSALALSCEWTYAGERAYPVLSPGIGALALSCGAAVFLAAGFLSIRVAAGLSPGKAARACAVGVVISGPSGKLRLALCGISIAAVVLGLVCIWFYPGDSGTLYEISRALHGELRDSFGSSRIRIWRGVLAIIPEHPLLGAGPGTLSLRLDISFSRYVEETGKTLSTFVDNSHNEFLGLLADVGALGLGAFLAAGTTSLIGFIRRDGGAAALGCAVLCYWIQSFFGLGLCVVAPLMWLLWGLFESREYF